MDGQTERVNKTQEANLRNCMNYNQDVWYDLLPLAESASNNAEGATTNISRFFRNDGYHPVITWPVDQDVKTLGQNLCPLDVISYQGRVRKPQAD